MLSDGLSLDQSPARVCGIARVAPRLTTALFRQV